MHPKDFDVILHFNYETWLNDRARCTFWEIKMPGMAEQPTKMDAETAVRVLSVAEGFVETFKGMLQPPIKGVSRYDIARGIRK